VDASPEEPVELPVDGDLDLHTFRPAEVKDLVPHYLALCRAKGILRVRIVHGKGTGALRETVHRALERLDFVRTFTHGDERSGGWGATIVHLAGKQAP
jgi:dsDNA-specific endonuclease/ATPase MutS2